MTDLFPCPFCGSQAEFERIGSPRQSCIVVCENCGARLETNESERWSGEIWNQRHMHDPTCTPPTSQSGVQCPYCDGRGHVYVYNHYGAPVATRPCGICGATKHLMAGDREPDRVSVSSPLATDADLKSQVWEMIDAGAELADCLADYSDDCGNVWHDPGECAWCSNARAAEKRWCDAIAGLSEKWGQP